MLKQTDPVFGGTKIPAKGCYFCVLLWIAEETTKKPMSASTVLALMDSAQKYLYMDPDLYVNGPDGVLSLGMRALGDRKSKILQVGIHDWKGRRFWGWVKPAWQNYDWVVFKWRTQTGFHFTVGNREEIELYDPDPSVKRLALEARVLYRRMT